MKRRNWREISNGEKKGLKEGNKYSFAHLLLKVYPKFSNEMGFDFDKAVNSYKLYIDYDNGIFTFTANNGNKYFFDTEMKFRGEKTY